MSSQWAMFWSEGTGSPMQFGRSLPRCALLRRRAAVGDGDREAGSCLENAAHPPATEDRVDKGRDVRPIRASAAVRQLVVRREHQVMPRVEERRTVVPLRLVGVHPVGALCGDATRPVVAEVVGLDRAQRVRRQVLEPVHEALAEAHLQRVVVAAATCGSGRDVGDERRGREQRTALLSGSQVDTSPVPASGWLPSTGVTR